MLFTVEKAGPGLLNVEMLNAHPKSIKNPMMATIIAMIREMDFKKDIRPNIIFSWGGSPVSLKSVVDVVVSDVFISP
ncbi:hypothetical protein GCM10025861_03620 [Methanobacterium petrolearium]|nr:hypothetical protein GCM10025861_03620 [Methanobacterium petrolearium]